MGSCHSTIILLSRFGHGRSGGLGPSLDKLVGTTQAVWYGHTSEDQFGTTLLVYSGVTQVDQSSAFYVHLWFGMVEQQKKLLVQFNQLLQICEKDMQF